MSGIGLDPEHCFGDTPALMGERRLDCPVECHTLATRVEVSKPCVVFALDAAVGEFGEQCGMPDCIECSRDVQSDYSDLVGRV